MSIISIDDRDVINNYHTNNIVNVDYKEYLARLKIENPLCNILHLGLLQFKIEFPDIECTGLDITTLFNIPFPHQLNLMELKHTDANYIDSTDSFGYSLSHRYNNMWVVLLSINETFAYDILDEYIGYVYNQTQYRLITNSTNLDHVSINIILQIRGI